MLIRNRQRVRNLGNRLDFDDWTTEVTGALQDHEVVYDGIGDAWEDDADSWVASSRMGTVLAIGFGVLVVVLVVAQVVMAVRR